MPRSRADDRISTVADALNGIYAPELKRLAAFVSADALPTRKGELVALLSERLERDDVVRAVWDRLDELGRAAVSEVVHGQTSRLDRARFRAKYGREPDWGSIDRHQPDGRTTGLRLFLYCGGVMPDDLRERLRAFVPSPAAAVLDTVDDLPTAFVQRSTCYDPATHSHEEASKHPSLFVCETERAAFHDLDAVLRLVESGKLAVSDKTRRPTAASMRLIGDVLDGGDFCVERDAGAPIKAFAWPMLVQAAGLAELRGTRLALTKAGVKALGTAPATVIRTLWERWLGTRIFDELTRIDAIKGQTGKGKRGLTAVATRRGAVADALAECPLGRWFETDKFLRYMRAAGHEFEVTRDAWSLYLCDPQYGSLGYEGYGGWNILQARFALCLLFEYAATLGLVDVAYVPAEGARPDFHEQWGTDGLEYLSRYDGLTYVRITPLGAYCFGCSDAYRPARIEARTPFTVLANLEMAAIGERLTFADRLVIERYAEQSSDRVWRLSRDKLLSAIEQGDSISDVRDFLAARSAAPLPASVTSLLDDLAERTQRLVDRGSMRVIDCADPALVALLVNDAKTRALCIPAGENRLLVPAGSEPAFRRAVRKLGYAVAPGEHTRAAA